jgi:hypothetical protein
MSSPNHRCTRFRLRRSGDGRCRTGSRTHSPSATLAQLLTARSAPWVAASSGSIALAAGMVMIVLASASDSGVTYLVGSIVGGAGFGAAFLGGLRALVAAIPPEQRAAVIAAFFVVAYGSLSLPAVLAGVLVTHISLQSTFEIFGSAVAAIALLVALQAWRTRPQRRLVPVPMSEPAQP